VEFDERRESLLIVQALLVDVRTVAIVEQLLWVERLGLLEHSARQLGAARGDEAVGVDAPTATLWVWPAAVSIRCVCSRRRCRFRCGCGEGRQGRQLVGGLGGWLAPMLRLFGRRSSRGEDQLV
jgi:hypothetical protein